jgi:hypothetical protein
LPSAPPQSQNFLGLIESCWWAPCRLLQWLQRGLELGRLKLVIK